mmetsp:Transcript_52967/g.124057  ORF Transcript_52967/g.124057 Transcript_52967/m.124057 type:complete len:429 (+) Transcript_52967:137-1423(+)
MAAEAQVALSNLDLGWGTQEEIAQALLILCRPALLLSLFLAGWAADLLALERFNIDYATVIGLRQDELGNPRLFFIAALLLAAIAGSANVWAVRHPSEPTILWLPVVVYLGLMTLLFVPLPGQRGLAARVPLRKSLLRCLWQSQSRETPFIDVLVADGMTSMARAFFDIGVGSCVMYETGAGPSPFGYAGLEQPSQEEPRLQLGEAMRKCNLSLFPHAMLAVPFLIRARQCIVTAHCSTDAYKRRVQLTNLAKYMSALPVILFSFFFKHAAADGDVAGIEELWMFAALVNAVFSAMWDLVFDWGLLQPSNMGLRPVLLLRPAFPTYHCMVALNLTGRTLWSLQWSSECKALGTAVCGTVQQCLEVSRRCMWNVLRVEWECIKTGLNKCPASHSECPTPQIPEELEMVSPHDEVTNRSVVLNEKEALSR